VDSVIGFYWQGFMDPRKFLGYLGFIIINNSNIEKSPNPRGPVGDSLMMLEIIIFNLIPFHI
jgi:hypothetical protein